MNTIKQGYRLKITLILGLCLLFGLSMFSMWSSKEKSGIGGNMSRQSFGQVWQGGRASGEGTFNSSGNRQQGSDGRAFSQGVDRQGRDGNDGGDHPGTNGYGNGDPTVNGGGSANPGINGSGNGGPAVNGGGTGSPGMKGGADSQDGGGSSRGSAGLQGGRFGGGFGSSLPYSVPLVWYGVFFFVAAIGLYFFITRKNVLLPEDQVRTLLWFVLGAGLLLRLAAAPWIPGHPDMTLFRSWAAQAAKGLSGFYANGSSDYPPFYIIVLFVIGKLAAVSAFSPYTTFLLKLPAMLADMATAYLLYRAARKRLSAGAGLLIASFYAFNPAVFINSTFWGQVDSFFTLLVTAAILLLSESRIGWSAALFTAAVLMKPQGIIFAPVFFFELVRLKRIRPWLLASASALVTAIVVVLPFSIGRNPVWLIKLYTGTINEYPYASVNAFNFFALMKANYVRDTAKLLFVSYHAWGILFIMLITLFSWWMYGRKADSRFAAAAALAQIAGVFTFATSMHERYLFPSVALALLAFIYLKDKRFLQLGAGFSLTVFLNTHHILYHSARGGAVYDFTLILTSLMNVLLCIYLARVMWRPSAASRDLGVVAPEPLPGKPVTER